MEFKRGRFIVIDGVDGAGKATQTDLLVRRLVQEGYDAKKLSFPQYGKNIFADTIAEILGKRFEAPGSIDPYLLSPIYAADRLKAAPEIRNEIQRGTILATDRYTSASMGHQASKIKNNRERQEFIEWLRRMEFSEEGFNIPAPDLTAILYVKPEVSYELAKQRSQTIGRPMDGVESDIEYQKRSAETFLEIAKSEPSWRIINCLNEEGNNILTQEEISAEIWSTVEPYLPKIFDRRGTNKDYIATITKT